MASVSAVDIIVFDLDDDVELRKNPEAIAALAAFKASPHFAKITEALWKQADNRLNVATAAVPVPDDGDVCPMDLDQAERDRADKRAAHEVQFVHLAKDDVEQLWQHMHKDGPPSEWTKEQLSEAVVNVQRTKHRKTTDGQVYTGGG